VLLKYFLNDLVTSVVEHCYFYCLVERWVVLWWGWSPLHLGLLWLRLVEGQMWRRLWTHSKQLWSVELVS